MMMVRGNESSWVVRTPRANSCLRLLCLTYAGGGASAFRGWSERLPADVEVCAWQPPGRETRLREAPHTKLEELVAQLLQETRALREQDYVLFGHSLGGLVAFEFARALRRAGERLPAGLIVSACGAPQLAKPEFDASDLSDAALMSYLRRFEGTPQAILESSELIALLLPILRADFSLRETYTYQAEPALELPIAAFGGVDDGHVAQAELQAWAQQTSRRFALQRFEGGHFYFRSARDFFGALRRALAWISRSPSPSDPRPHFSHLDSP